MLVTILTTIAFFANKIQKAVALQLLFNFHPYNHLTGLQ